MSGSVVDDLSERLAGRRVVVVAGSGVTAAATGGHRLSSWSGLIESGIEHAAGLPGVARGRLDAAWSLLGVGGNSALISAGELVTEMLGGREGGEYARWLRDTVGSLELVDRSVPEALLALGVPVSTTNYDDLIESASADWERVTWLDGGGMLRALQGDVRAVAHLHGYWFEPRSVILGVRSYEELGGRGPTQALQRAMATMNSLLFVGVGDEASDPSFGALREWLARMSPDSRYRHYRLCLHSEVNALSAEYVLGEQILPVGYGNSHEDLAGFMSELATVSRSRSQDISRRGALTPRSTKWLALRTLHGHQGEIWGCAFSPDRQLASAGDDGTVRLWDGASWEEYAVLHGHQGEIWGCAFSPDRQLLASAGDDGTVRLWDADSGVARAQLTGHDSVVRAVAFSPDGKLLASAGDDGTVRLWDTDSGVARAPLTGHDSVVSAVAFSPDGKLLVSAGADGTVRLWDADSGAAQAALTGHSSSVRAVAFNPDGKLIASASEDATVRLWDVANGEEHAVLRGHIGPSYGCAFSPDGRLLASTGSDQTVRLWGEAGALTVLPSALDGTGGSVAVLPTVASDVASGEDLLDVGRDVNAIANLVAARETVPPLSIGLFGDWGSGKSFFIGEVQKRVRHLASISQDAEISPYCSHVRNISFNAWHYADANLWASLVTHIFDELAKLELPLGTESDATAFAQVARLEEKLAESSALKVRLKRAREHRRQVQARRKLLFWTWKLAGVEGERSLGDVQSDARETWNAVKLLVPNARARLALLGLAVFAAFVAFAVVVFAGGEQVIQTLVTVGAAVAVPLSAFALVRRHVLRLLQQTGETARAIDVRDADIDAELETASAAELELQQELSDLSAGRRLARMASQRSGDYREHLGLVSRIHDDFVQMSKLLRGETDAGRMNSDEAHKDGDLPQIDRIVLYIDDLDRCPPRRVMEVLEAVHLILAVPLFVVVVAVDPRWLLQSLKLHYAELLAQEAQRRDQPPGGQPERVVDSWGSSPIDYLEKIIQVPFTLQPMTNASVRSLVHGLLPAESPEESPAAHEQREPARSTKPDELTGPSEPAQPVSQPAEEQPHGAAEPLPQPESAPVTAVEPTPAVDVPGLDTRTLMLTQAECDFAATVAAGLRTPRTVKKFTNLYRLLRAGLDQRAGALERFLREGTGDAPEYQAVLILLAAIIAFTDDAPTFLARLLQQPTGEDLWIDYLRDVKPPTRGGNLLDVLKAIAAEHSREQQWTCEPFRRWALEVSRYSFATGQEVFAHSTRAAPPPST